MRPLLPAASLLLAIALTGCEKQRFQDDLEFIVEYGTYANHCYLAVRLEHGAMGMLSPECIRFEELRDRYEEVMDTVYAPALWQEVDDDTMRDLRRATNSVNRLLRRIETFGSFETTGR